LSEDFEVAHSPGLGIASATIELINARRSFVAARGPQHSPFMPVLKGVYARF
jgi:hypothetical protein